MVTGPVGWGSFYHDENHEQEVIYLSVLPRKRLNVARLLYSMVYGLRLFMRIVLFSCLFGRCKTVDDLAH